MYERLRNKTGGDHRALQRDAEFEPATVTAVIPIVPQAPQLQATARPLSQTSDQKSSPIFSMPGWTRNLRVGMTAALLYADGSPQASALFGHTYNLDNATSVYGDPMPVDVSGNLLVVNPDDMVAHHDETLSYMRWRNRLSTPTTAAADGSPCAWEHTFASGFTTKVTEYVPPGSTPGAPIPPTRAKFEIDMPLGASLVLDEPADGESTLAYTHPSGATVTIDMTGKVTVNSPDKVLVVAPDVELGADNGKTLSFHQELSALTTWAQSHEHTGVATGGGVSGPPAAAPPVPVGTVNTHAV